jgi:hypothetical protein
MYKFVESFSLAQFLPRERIDAVCRIAARPIVL